MTIERHFGRRPTSKALSRMGLSAALWDIGYRERGEIARPGCAKTNVISVWTRGATYSDLHIDGVRRFSQIRDTGSFQMARAGEALSAVLTKTTGQCLDLYLPTSVIGTALEVECENVALGFELLPTKVAHDPDITRIAADIVLEIASPGVASALALDAATLLLAVTLIRRWSNQAEQIKLPKNGLAPWQVRRALERLGASLHEDISLKDLARDVGLSPFHFARAFKASVGSPPHRHLTMLRLERARMLLDTTNIAVKEIAAQVGYADPSYFAGQFKRTFKVGPRAYRQERRSSPVG